MATLTTSFQMLDQTYIGTSGGNLYVRIYAKYTEQDIPNNRTYVVYEARSYYDKTYIYDQQGIIGVSGTGTSYQSASCTRPTSGESVSVSTEGWVYHNNDGAKSIDCAASISFPNWGWGGTASGSADLPRIPRASGVACSSPYIGDNAIISIDKKASSFANTLTYKIGTLTGTIATKTSETTVQFQTSKIEDQIYALIPNAKEIKGTIYCTTYNGSTQIGDTQSTSFNLYAKESVCKPDVTATIVDTNTSVTSITGSNTKFVKYISKPKVNINATAKKSSTIKSYSINLNDGQTSNLQENTFDNVGSNKVIVSATDSRGYSSSLDVELDMIDYIKLHINTISITRPEGTSNEAILNCNGAYYNGSFTDTTANTLSGSFKYRKSGTTDWTDGGSITPTITDNTFKVTELSLGNLFDYEEEYQFEIAFEDKFVVTKEIVPLEKGRETIFIGDNEVLVYGDLLLNDKSLREIDFCQMHTNFTLKDFSDSSGLIEVEGWEEPMNIGDYVADVANNRIIIKNTTLVEVGGNTAGSGDGSIKYSLKESSGDTSLLGNEGWFIFQGNDVGSGYWAMSLKTCIVELDPTKIYYLQLTASGYNEQTFAMNNGFGKFATNIYARKLK